MIVHVQTHYIALRLITAVYIIIRLYREYSMLPDCTVYYVNVIMCRTSNEQDRIPISSSSIYRYCQAEERTTPCGAPHTE